MQGQRKSGIFWHGNKERGLCFNWGGGKKEPPYQIWSPFWRDIVCAPFYSAFFPFCAVGIIQDHTDAEKQVKSINKTNTCTTHV